MISKNEVKYIQSLSDKKNRDREGVFVAEGPKLVQELLSNGLTSKIIYTTEEIGLPANAEIKQVDEISLQRLSHWETANKMVAVFKKPILPPLSFQTSLVLALDGFQDPGNLGTIIRTADWFGITTIIATPDTADCFNNKVVQSTMGSIARVQMHYADAAGCFNQLVCPCLVPCCMAATCTHSQKSGSAFW